MPSNKRRMAFLQQALSFLHAFEVKIALGPNGENVPRKNGKLVGEILNELRKKGSKLTVWFYLKATAERHKVFQDLFNLSTYMIPGMKLPPLPPALKRSLDFQLREHIIKSP